MSGGEYTHSSKKITFLVGSGFSKALADIPTQDRFLPEVLSQGRKEWIICNLNIDDKEEEIIMSITDPEILLSYLFHRDTEDRKEQRQREYKKAIINFRMALNEFLKEQDKINKQAEENFTKLIEKLQKGYTINFITTNYDLILEDVLKDMNIKYDYCLNGCNSNDNNVKLLKIHGSINWIERRKLNKELKKGVDKKYLNSHVMDNIERFNKVKCKNEKGYMVYKLDEHIYTPITIPFFYQKYDWYSERWSGIFRDGVWKEAEAVLSESNIIIFIGYGFPQADYPILSLFIKAKFWEKVLINIGRNCNSFDKAGITPSLCTGCWLEQLDGDRFIRLLETIR